MILIIGDGRNPPLRLEVKFLVAYDHQGISVLAAETISDRHTQVGTLGDPDLRDIALRNGLPYRPAQDVTENFPDLPKGQVFSIK